MSTSSRPRIHDFKPLLIFKAHCTVFLRFRNRSFDNSFRKLERLEAQEPHKMISGRNIIKDPEMTGNKVPVSFLSFTSASPWFRG